MSGSEGGDVYQMSSSEGADLRSVYEIELFNEVIVLSLKW